MKIVKDWLLRKLRPVRVRRKVRFPIDSVMADFYTFHGFSKDKEHIAIALGPVHQTDTPLVRIHSECLTGDVFHSGQCDCGEQLNEAKKKMEREGGIILYLRQEGRGIGLYNKLDAYHWQSLGLDTYEANERLGFPKDLRDYSEAADILKALGVHQIKLLTNNPDKKQQIEEYGIKVKELVRTGVFLKPTNQRYLEAKVTKTNHMIGLSHAIRP